MANPTSIQASERDLTLNPRQLRSAGFIPGTLYGQNIDSRSIQVKQKEFTTHFHHGRREFELAGLSETIVARAHKVQVNPLNSDILSVEFLQISPKGEPRAERAPKAKKQSAPAKKAPAEKKAPAKAPKAKKEEAETVHA